ncbi:MAG: cadherin-like beta sandwich domain-containing protein, partial [Clostridia bacterium]|nr:cadherin-like beta sandwich domain-containing protein [Clostridia bacterium]
GENTVKVLVTAENGTSTTYTIKVTRKRVPIALKTLVVKYQNENGELIETPLNPAFNFDTLEYTLQDLEYWVEKLNIEAIPNIEGATIDIQGADNLQVGENTITITVKIAEENTPEGEEAKEETITYTIKFNKIAEPTLIAKIQDWFKGIFGGIGSWYNNNQDKVILGALGVCIVALIGLSVYIVVDYNKYKDVIAKVKKVTELNSNEVAVEEIEQESNIVEEKNIEDNNKNDRPKGGKHF